MAAALRLGFAIFCLSPVMRIHRQWWFLVNNTTSAVASFDVGPVWAMTKRKEDIAKEVTQRAKDLHDKEFQLPYEKPMACLAEKKMLGWSATGNIPRTP
ncbi:hypothetical protein RJ639_029776 [Escallonia herrerae]|uniref:Uncharacterized protein n=1 Tax=Escallonia herrerae TaxID=1293975 RepID=A0AA88X245_9ASTE|nr:hypothetical protein RJ639_029776 [Escallonia herrerae]